MDQTQNSPSWWESTLDFVVRAAATKRFSTPDLQSGQTYYVDNNGNVLPAGQVVTATSTQNSVDAAMANPMVVMVALALTGVLLYKLVK